MIQAILQYRLDLIAFFVLSLTAAFAINAWLLSGRVRLRVRAALWFALSGLVVSGVVLALLSEDRQRSQLRATIAGVAPTYAYELASHGHHKITLATQPDDPDYLALIEYEKRWLRINPHIHDICTLRRLAADQIAILVDSETDYDRDGVYQGVRESRTPLGQEHAESTSEMLARCSMLGFSTIIIGTVLGATGLAAFLSADDREKCLAAGMDDHVTKPIVFNQLFETIARHVVLPTNPEATQHNPTCEVADTQTATHEASEESLPVLDRHTLFERIGDDRELIGILTEALREDGQARISELRHALDKNDLPAAKRAAHTLKGTAGNMSAMQLADVARQAEHAASSGDEAAILAAVAKLETSLGLALQELESLLKDETATCG